MFCITQENQLRRLCIRAVRHRAFEGAILTAVVGSSIVLAMDTPHLRLDGRFAERIDRANLAFTAVFALEALLKICALGLWSTPGEHTHG